MMNAARDLFDEDKEDYIIDVSGHPRAGLLERERTVV
jgi:hypothetical protein